MSKKEVLKVYPKAFLEVLSIVSEFSPKGKWYFVCPYPGAIGSIGSAATPRGAWKAASSLLSIGRKSK